MAICRKIFGWQKQEDDISLRQLEKATGLTRPTVIEGVDGLVNFGIITSNT